MKNAKSVLVLLITMSTLAVPVMAWNPYPYYRSKAVEWIKENHPELADVDDTLWDTSYYYWWGVHVVFEYDGEDYALYWHGKIMFYTYVVEYEYSYAEVEQPKYGGPLDRDGYIDFEGDLLRYKLPAQYSVLIVHLDRKPNKALMVNHTRVHVNIDDYSRSCYVKGDEYVTIYYPWNMLNKTSTVSITNGVDDLVYNVIFVG